MNASTDRILTTHVGSLPRPGELFALVDARERGEPVDEARFDATAARAIAEVVARQAAAGVDVVGDGEFSKASYTFYVRHRLAGIGLVDGASGTLPKTGAHRDLLEHPDYHARLLKTSGQGAWFTRRSVPACTGPITYADDAPLRRDLANLRNAVAAATPRQPAGAFITAASPGVLTKFVPDLHYRDEDDYVEALANAMRAEYEAIHAAGFILQIDAPDLGSARHNQYAHLSDDEFLRVAARNIEALNHATARIPPAAMRMHVCWGNYEGPHTHDIPLARIWDTVMAARPAGLLFEGANPRHAHEWEDLERVRIPDEKVLIPGVIDSTTNFVEHPRLIAQRIRRYTARVGRERVIAGTDCGFATFAGTHEVVAPSIVWAKLAALAEGAAIASDALWGR